MNDDNGCGTALVTGASAGIGAIYADRLARRGFDLILVARNDERLRAVARRVRAASGRTVQTIKADLKDSADLLRVDAVLRENASVTMLVNNAGFGAVTPLLQLGTLCFGADYLARASLRLNYGVTLRGVPRDDIRPGLRVTHHKGRTLIAYAVDEDSRTVSVLGIFYGGQDYEAALSAD